MINYKLARTEALIKASKLVYKDTLNIPEVQRTEVYNQLLKYITIGIELMEKEVFTQEMVEDDL